LTRLARSQFHAIQTSCAQNYRLPLIALFVSYATTTKNYIGHDIRGKRVSIYAVRRYATERIVVFARYEIAQNRRIIQLKCFCSPFFVHYTTIVYVPLARVTSAMVVYMCVWVYACVRVGNDDGVYWSGGDGSNGDEIDTAARHGLCVIAVRGATAHATHNRRLGVCRKPPDRRRAPRRDAAVAQPLHYNNTSPLNLRDNGEVGERENSVVRENYYYAIFLMPLYERARNNNVRSARSPKFSIPFEATWPRNSSPPARYSARVNTSAAVTFPFR